MNARLVVDAEAHYHAVFRGGHDSWDLRDGHMVHTLDALDAHLGRGRAEPARAVVWARNSHVGDARATDMRQAGQVNVGGPVNDRLTCCDMRVRAGSKCGRLRAAAAMAITLVVAVLAAAPVLWLFGALDEVQWSNDFITAVTIAVVVYAAITIGFVIARPRALLLVWLLSVLWIVIEELRWDPPCSGSGMDDMSPIVLVPFSPFFMSSPRSADGSPTTSSDDSPRPDDSGARTEQLRTPD